MDRAGRRPPCPNGAPLEIFGQVARREEAAGASRWGLGVRKLPLETMGAKYGAAAAGYLAPGFGSELVREAPHRQVARQGGSMAAVETPFSLSLIHISEPTRPY